MTFELSGRRRLDAELGPLRRIRRYHGVRLFKRHYVELDALTEFLASHTLSPADYQGVASCRSARNLLLGEAPSETPRIFSRKVSDFLSTDEDSNGFWIVYVAVFRCQRGYALHIDTRGDVPACHSG